MSAIARLDGRVTASPVRKPWFRRSAWQGYTRALQLQGVEIDEIDVLAWACGVHLPNRPLRTSHLDEFAAFDPWLIELGRRPAEWLDRLPFTPEIDATIPMMMRAIALAGHYAGRDGSAQPWLHLPIFLRGVGIVENVLPCLVGGAKALRFRPTVTADAARSVLNGLASAADAGLASLDDLEKQKRRAIAAMRGEKRTGSLMRLSALSVERPVLSPVSVSTTLDMTISGAGKLLDRASDLGLLVEVSDRKSWKVFMTPDLAIKFGFRDAPRGRPPREIEIPPDRDLAAAYDAFDKEMAEFEARFGPLVSEDVEEDDY